MTIVVDDHLLGDLIGESVPRSLAGLLNRHEVRTTNLYYYRLCRATLASRGGRLTASWSQELRAQATEALGVLVPSIRISPLQDLAFRMARLATRHGLSALGAEAIAAAENAGAVLCVWEGDDGPSIRAACRSAGVGYRTIPR